MSADQHPSSLFAANSAPPPDTPITVGLLNQMMSQLFHEVSQQQRDTIRQEVATALENSRRSNSGPSHSVTITTVGALSEQSLCLCVMKDMSWCV